MSQHYAWFDPAPAYEGPGIAETHGNVERRSDYFQVTFDEAGLPEPPIGIGTKSLTVPTTQGMFSMTYPSRNHIPDAQFESSTDTPAQYWVLPLVNFISRFQDDRGTFDEHPMRLHSATNHFKAARAPLAPVRIPVWSNVIGFSFANEPAFIEALPDYATRQNRLKQGTDDVLITAVMVGRVPTEAPVDLSGLDDWIPYDLLSLLSLATNRFVGAPWVELRNTSGQLIRRIHRPLNVAPFAHGRAVQTVSDLSSLLSGALASPWHRNRVLSTVTRRLVRSMTYSPTLTLDDRFNHLCRTLEGLYRIYPPSDSKRAMSLDALDTRDRQAAIEILEQAVQRLRKQAQVSKQKGTQAQMHALYRLADRVRSAPVWKESDFGEKLDTMLHEAGFADAEVAARHYSADEAKGRSDWLNALRSFRNDTTHEGSFSIAGYAERVSDIHDLSCHLHDILVRLILKLYGYRHRYRPFVAIPRDHPALTPSPRPIDWVQPDTNPEQLGYSSTIKRRDWNQGRHR